MSYERPSHSNTPYSLEADEDNPVRDGLPPPNFRYEPLNREVDSIRVLQVLPWQDDGVIRCKMKNTTITGTAYKCLSYTWLPTSPEHIIEINGSAKVVGHNLFLFLVAFCAWHTRPSPYIDTPIWIDAICIDQYNTDERSQQVQQMGSIYKGASQVLIWLGDLDDDLLWFLRESYAMVEARVAESETLGFNGNNDWREGGLRKRVAERLKKHVGIKELLSGQFARFQSLPYWTRLWVAQEVLLSARVMIIFEDRTIEMTALQRAIEALHGALNLSLNTEQGRFSSKSNMFMTYADCRDPGRNDRRITFPMGFPALLAVFQTCECRETRDRIYALLSLARTRPPIAVDYNHDSIWLFQKILLQNMENSALDQLLWLGALLIQALELRCPSDYAKRLQRHRPAGAVNIGTPMWADATLEIVKSSKEHAGEDHGSSRVIMQCMYVPIYDGDNTHVLEFATKDSGDGLVVEFGRCHEFLRGYPHDYPDSETDGCFWLGMPSECVYYIDTGSLARGLSPARLLNAWEGPEVEHICNLPLDNELYHEPSLALSKRCWIQEDVWRSYEIASEMFSPAYEAAMQTLDTGEQYELLSDTTGARGTIVRWMYI